jgi:hypothetical protein
VTEKETKHKDKYSRNDKIAILKKLKVSFVFAASARVFFFNFLNVFNK